MNIIPIILSGGSGVRLWPLSRKDYPKPYLPLVSNHTLLQETLLRLQGLDGLGTPIIVCNTNHRFLVAQQCQAIGTQAVILLEPVARNTCPAIVAAALYARLGADTENTSLLVLPADHNIQDIAAFHQSVKQALEHAKTGQLVTFGVVPTQANTGYGYIKANTFSTSQTAYPVETFVEKPDKATAQRYLATGGYFWNSGMFVFTINTLLNELNTHCASIVKAVTQSVAKAVKEFDFIRLDGVFFAQCPHVSIDYALLEKSNNVSVVPLNAAWSDVGTWSALHDVNPKNDNNNVIQGDVLTQETHNTYINAHHLVTTIGVDNLIIINTPDATLVANRDKADEVKNIVERLEKNNRNEAHSHCKTHRPWGWYDVIEQGEFFQVKKLHVNPHAKLSLQLHRQRAEHWVVVKGIATIINDEQRLTLLEGQSTYIPINTKHCLNNQSDQPLEVIEVQSGGYLGEDDIERFEDDYGRTNA